MKRVFVISTLLLLTSTVRSQDAMEDYMAKFVKSEADKISLKEITNDDLQVIRIWQSDYQVLELRKSKENIVSGELINYVTKYNRKDKPVKVIKESIQLNQNVAEYLLINAISLNIQSIKDPDEINGYPQGLDGKTTTIETYLDKNYRVASYWELENDHYQNPDNSDIKEIRSILKLINDKISWWPLFKSFRDQLKPGAYRYGGINMTLMK